MEPLPRDTGCRSAPPRGEGDMQVAQCGRGTCTIRHGLSQQDSVPWAMPPWLGTERKSGAAQGWSADACRRESGSIGLQVAVYGTRASGKVDVAGSGRRSRSSREGSWKSPFGPPAQKHGAGPGYDCPRPPTAGRCWSPLPVGSPPPSAPSPHRQSGGTKPQGTNAAQPGTPESLRRCTPNAPRPSPP